MVGNGLIRLREDVSKDIMLALYNPITAQINAEQINVKPTTALQTAQLSSLTPLTARERMLYSTIELEDESRVQKYPLIKGKNVAKLLAYREIVNKVVLDDYITTPVKHRTTFTRPFLRRICNPQEMFAFQEGTAIDAVDVFVLNYHNYNERAALRFKLQKLAQGLMRPTDYLVIDKLVENGLDHLNLWKEHGNPLIADLVPKQLLGNGTHAIDTFSYQKIAFEYNHMITMGDYLGLAALVLDFEQKVLVGGSNVSVTMNEGILQCYAKKLAVEKEINGKERENVRRNGESLPSLFLVVNDLHCKTNAVQEFCTDNGLHYALLKTADNYGSRNI